MSRRTWMWTPDRGGRTVPPAVRERTERRIRAYANLQYAGTFTRLDVRFRGALCYIDAYTEPEEPSRSTLRVLGETRCECMDRLRSIPTHLCRLRFFGDEDAWGLAFYTYSAERYETSVFEDGRFQGTPEAGFDVGAAYLRSRQRGRRGRRTTGCT